MLARSLCRIAGVFTLCGLLVPDRAEAQTTKTSDCGASVHEAEGSGVVFLPEDQIFCRLLADPKESRSFVSLLRGTFPSLSDPGGRGTTIASVGLGDSVGLVRWGGPSPGEGLQLDVVGSIFAQFDIGQSSNDLINADYIIGVPLTIRRGGTSARARFYHQSSHQGDEYLLRPQDIARENLSFESFDVLVSQELRGWRVYAGTEWLVRRDPSTLASKVYHAGAEARTGRAGPLRLVGAVDLKIAGRDDLSPAVSGRLGIELLRSSSGGHPARPVTLMLELYDGPSPYGQFFQDDVSLVGVGLHFGL